MRSISSVRKAGSIKGESHGLLELRVRVPPVRRWSVLNTLSKDRMLSVREAIEARLTTTVIKFPVVGES